MEAMTPLGRRIQDKRREMGLTLAQLSAKTGLSPQTINAIERGGSRNPRISNLRVIATALDLDLNVLAADVYAESVA